MKKFLVDWIKKDKKILIASLFVGFLFTTVAGIHSTKNYSDKIQKEIAQKVIRLHILANSNDDFDQALKLKVRDGIIEKYKNELELSTDINETRQFLKNNLPDIKSEAENIMKENGYNYSASVSLSKSVFPTKYYGEFSFPPGEYEALKIEIGSAEGENWWCVMFPPLCFVDITQYKEKEDNIQLKNISEKKKNKEEENSQFSNVKGKEKTFKTLNETFSLSMKTETVYANTKEKTSLIDTTKRINSDTNIKEKTKPVITEKSKEIIKNTVSDETYKVLNNKNETPELVVKFKVVEFWQSFNIWKK